MKNVIIIHGKPTKERYLDPAQPKPHEANWLPSLGADLANAGLQVDIPEMPIPYDPQYLHWKKIIEPLDLTEETVLVGHSIGVEFILRLLSEDPALVIGGGLLIGAYRNTKREFCNFPLDSRLVARAGWLTLFNSLDDTPDAQAAAERLRSKLPGMSYREFDGYGHFILGNNMTSAELPEARDEILAHL